MADNWKSHFGLKTNEPSRNTQSTQSTSGWDEGRIAWGVGDVKSFLFSDSVANFLLWILLGQILAHFSLMNKKHQDYHSTTNNSSILNTVKTSQSASSVWPSQVTETLTSEVYQLMPSFQTSLEMRENEDFSKEGEWGSFALRDWECWKRVGGPNMLWLLALCCDWELWWSLDKLFVW